MPESTEVSTVVEKVRVNSRKRDLPTNLRRAVCYEYMRDFDLERVAEMFDTDVSVIRRVVNSKTMQNHLDSALGDVADLDQLARRRLLEALLEEAFEEEQSKARTEARKILARHYLPQRSEVKEEHRYFIEIPQKASRDDWEGRYALEDPDDKILEGEVIEDE